jgi:hypothetical protein
VGNKGCVRLEGGSKLCEEGKRIKFENVWMCMEGVCDWRMRLDCARREDFVWMCTLCREKGNKVRDCLRWRIELC